MGQLRTANKRRKRTLLLPNARKEAPAVKPKVASAADTAPTKR